MKQLRVLLLSSEGLLFLWQISPYLMTGSCLGLFCVLLLHLLENRGPPLLQLDPSCPVYVQPGVSRDPQVPTHGSRHAAHNSLFSAGPCQAHVTSVHSQELSLARAERL